MASNQSGNQAASRAGDQARHVCLLKRAMRCALRVAMFFDDLVVMARGETPDPIPNSAVKTLSADGTAS